jgi:hypothetical protein
MDDVRARGADAEANAARVRAEIRRKRTASVGPADLGVPLPAHADPPPRRPSNRQQLDWARTYFAAGEIELVLGAANAVVRNSPTRPEEAEARRLRAWAFASRGSYEDAVADAEEALLWEPYSNAGPVTTDVLHALLPVWRARR